MKYESKPEQTFVFRSDDEGKTRRFAESLAMLLKAGDVLTLSGDLGAGKTTFTQGLAKGLGISERVNSPTFTIIKEYYGRLPLYHMDAYRLEGVEEDLGFQEYFEGEGITVVEWPEMIANELPKELLSIEISSLSLNEREIRLTPYGTHFEEVCKEIAHEYTGI